MIIKTRELRLKDVVRLSAMGMPFADAVVIKMGMADDDKTPMAYLYRPYITFKLAQPLTGYEEVVIYRNDTPIELVKREDGPMPRTGKIMNPRKLAEEVARRLREDDGWWNSWLDERPVMEALRAIINNYDGAKDAGAMPDGILVTLAYWAVEGHEPEMLAWIMKLHPWVRDLME